MPADPPRSLYASGVLTFAHEDVLQPVLDRLFGAAKALRVGDPLDPATEVGPLTQDREVERIDRWVHPPGRSLPAVEVAVALTMTVGSARSGAGVSPGALSEVRP